MYKRQSENDAAGKITIKADGFYFDAREEVNVYLGNISVHHPDYNLTATKKLKLYFSKNEQGEQNISHIIALGDVFLESFNEQGKYQRAKAETIEYNLQKEEIYLINGYPALEKEGQGTMQAQKENVWMRLYSDGSLITSPDGAWEIVYTNLERSKDSQ